MLSSPDVHGVARPGPGRSPVAFLLLSILFVASLAALFGGPLAAHVRLAATPGVFNDDVRAMVYPFLRYEDPASFQGDYAGEYHLSALHPTGYRAMYTLAARFRAVEAVSKFLPYPLLLLTLLGVGLAAWKFGGFAGAWVAVALCLGSSIYLSCVVGGLPRAFGYPLIGGIMVALLRGSVRGLAVLAIAGAAFYPTVGFIAGLCLVLLVFDPFRSDRGEALPWTPIRRIATVGAVAAACVLLMLPQAFGSRRYGSLVREADIGQFPEAGPGGRYRADNRPPFRSFPRSAVRAVEDGIPGSGEPFVSRARRWLGENSESPRRRAVLGLLLAVCGIGWLRLAVRHAEARRFLLLPVAALIGHTLARPFYPYLYQPQRYTLYVVPPVAVVLLASGGFGLLPAGAAGRLWRPILGALPGLIALVVLGAHGSPDEGLNMRVASSEPGYAFLRNLPGDALVAGWPNGAVDNVPWVARKRSLVNFETHQAFHAEYTREMRRRASAVIEAFYATEPGPVVRLRKEFGVTHFLVDLDMAQRRDASYFAPFDREIERLRAQAEGKPLEILQQLDSAGVYRDGTFAVLDLSRIPAQMPTGH